MLISKNDIATLRKAVRICKDNDFDCQKYNKVLNIVNKKKTVWNLSFIPIILLALSFICPFILNNVFYYANIWYWIWTGATIVSLVTFWHSYFLIWEEESNAWYVWIYSIFTIAYNIIFVLPFFYLQNDYNGDGWLIAFIISSVAIITMVIAYLRCKIDMCFEFFDALDELPIILYSVAVLTALINIIATFIDYIKSWSEYMWKGFAFILALLAGIPLGIIKVVLMIFGSGYWWPELYDGILPWLSAGDWNTVFYGAVAASIVVWLAVCGIYSCMNRV